MIRLPVYMDNHAATRIDDAARSSVRFGLGRFNTAEEVEFVIHTVSEAVARPRQMGGLA